MVRLASSLSRRAAYAIILIVWQAASYAARGWLVGPLDILSAYADPGFASKLVEAYAVTATRALTGFLLGLVAGLGLGLLTAYIRVGEDVAEGLAAVASSVPSVAWIPLLIAAMGVDEFRLPVAVSFLCSFPPILYQSISAARSIDPEQVMVARTLGARGLFLWRTIILPSIVEKVFPAVKVEAAMVWKTVFAAEMVAVPSGLGYLAMLYADLLDVRHVAAIVALLAVTVAAIVYVVSRVEKLMLKRRGLGVQVWRLELGL